MLIDSKFSDILDDIKRMTKLTKAKIIREVFYYFANGNMSILFKIIEEVKENEKKKL